MLLLHVAFFLLLLFYYLLFDSEFFHQMESVPGKGKKSTRHQNHMQPLFAQPAAPLWRQQKCETVNNSLTKVINEVKVLSRCREKRVGGIKSKWWEGLRKKQGIKRCFTGQTSTSYSFLDGLVINCRSLRVWTPLGPHFKRAQTFCLLVSDLAWRMGRLWCSCLSIAPHLVGSTLAEIETLSPKVFSWHLYDHLLLPIATPTGALAIPFTINLTTQTPNRLPLIHGSQLQRSSEF